MKRDGERRGTKRKEKETGWLLSCRWGLLSCFVFRGEGIIYVDSSACYMYLVHGKLEGVKRAAE